MSIYELARIPRITAGVGAREKLGALVGAEDKPHALLVADPGLKGAGLIEETAAQLRKSGASLTVFDAFQSDPTVAQADAAAEIARREKANVVVCLGGGSALDLGKTVAAIALSAQSAGHYALFANPLPPKGLRKICAPTTSGTGSETTRTAILTRDDHAKVWLWGDEIKADDVVLDPEFTVSLPAPLTAATGVDALVHAVEAATNRNANPAANLFAHEAIRLVGRHLTRCCSSSQTILPRARLCNGRRRTAALQSTIAAPPSPMRSVTQWARCARSIMAARSGSPCWRACHGTSRATAPSLPALPISAASQAPLASSPPTRSCCAPRE